MIPTYDGSPVFPGYHADPEILIYNSRYYIYPTTDGSEGWTASSYKTFSSSDLINWQDKGVIFDFNSLSWGDMYAWAPAIAERNGTFYFYFCANQQIGVARSSSPTGPFSDALGRPLVTAGQFGGQSIDPDVFIDDDGQAYFFFGQGGCHVVRLASDMISFNGTPQNITPSGYNEGSEVFKRNGIYYLLWSENDTRSENYQVCYGTANNPMGPYTKANNNPILQKNPSLGILGTGHNSVLKIPERDEFYIIYHRFAIPGGDGYHREVCIDRMYFYSDGSILPVVPTLEGIGTPVYLDGSSGDPGNPGPFTGYLLSYFTTSAETLHYAYSLDGLTWISLNNGNTIVSSSIGNRSMRDPCVVRGQDGVFHLMATNSWKSREIVVFDSTDLINWTNQRLVTVAPSNASFAWAPECSYDPTAGQYRIYFATDINSIHKMYSVTTSDFINVSSPSVYYDPGTDRYAIDGTMVQYNGMTYMFFKYSESGPTGRGIQRVQASSLAGPWSNRSGPLTDDVVEGPTIFKDNDQNRWYLYYDYYSDGYWGCSTTTNPAGSWTQLNSNEFSLPSGVRHGNIIPVTTGELNALIDNWGPAGAPTPPTATSTPDPTPTPVVDSLGDVNEDNSINIIDALLVAQFYVGLNPSGFIQANADVNNDGQITIVDALLIAQYYVGLIDHF